MKLPTRQEEHTKLCKIPKFGVNWGNIEEDTASQENGLLDRFSEVHTFLSKLGDSEWLYLVQYWPDLHKT